MVDVQVVKVLVMCGLFVFTLALGLLPLLIVRCMQRQSARGISFHKQICYKRTLSILSCFAAGVFLATCLLELLPDVRKDLEMALDALKLKTEFPVAEFSMVFGLFTVLTIEQIVLTIKERHSAQPQSCNVHPNSKTPLLSDDSETLDNEIDARGFNRSISSEHSISGISDEPILASSYDNYYRQTSHDSHTHTDYVHQHSTLRSLLLLLAISIHSLFEGLAVGLQKKTESVLDIFTALLLHKGILSFSLGMSLVQSKLSKPAIIRSLFIFGLSAPVGIGIGIGIIDLWDSEVSTLVQGILQGIACGTFLYITFFEVLPHEFNSCDIRLVKVCFLIIGFAIVTGIMFLELKIG
ncbi:zinc transporter ZIP1-like [Ylistrum balloti]|uniref:zinc transporter ZIP1-like n=1 Tax=Ylistrum balloti TaxID=509963 RepID=UPI002905DEBD|nr:zinc transporter ZIP1-like [Ylistrum balloti]